MDLDEFLIEIASIGDDDWLEFASCKPAMSDAWFMDELRDDGLAGPTLLHVGKSICADCAVRIECLDNAIKHADSGIRMGLEDSERNAISRHRTKYRPFFKVDMRLALGDLMDPVGEEKAPVIGEIHPWLGPLIDDKSPLEYGVIGELIA